MFRRINTCFRCLFCVPRTEKDLPKAAASLRQVLDTFPEEMVKKARQYALTNFVTEDYAEKILTIYQAL